MAVPVLIALGSNVGDSLGSIQRAIDAISEFVTEIQASRPVKSAPMYVTDQPPFVNAALKGNSRLSPRELIHKFKEIESQVGRVKRERNGPREIDVDLIAYGALVYRFAEETIVPHPRLAERRFVLQPLAEIAPDFLIPEEGFVKDILKRTADQANLVQTIEDASFSIPG